MRNVILVLTMGAVLISSQPARAIDCSKGWTKIKFSILDVGILTTAVAVILGAGVGWRKHQLYEQAVQDVGNFPGWLDDIKLNGHDKERVFDLMAENWKRRLAKEFYTPSEFALLYGLLERERQKARKQGRPVDAWVEGAASKIGKPEALTRAEQQGLKASILDLFDESLDTNSKMDWRNLQTFVELTGQHIQGREEKTLDSTRPTIDYFPYVPYVDQQIGFLAAETLEG
jgi:hypothetical protein